MANIQEKTTVNSIYVRTSDGVDCTQLCRIGRNGLDVFLGISVTDGEPDGIYAVRQGCWMDDFAYMVMKSFGPEIFSRAANYSRTNPYRVRRAHTDEEGVRAYVLEYLEYDDVQKSYIMYQAGEPVQFDKELNLIHIDTWLEDGYFLPDLMTILRYIHDTAEERDFYAWSSIALVESLLQCPESLWARKFLSSHTTIEEVVEYTSVIAMTEDGFILPDRFVNQLEPMCDAAYDDED